MFCLMRILKLLISLLTLSVIILGGCAEYNQNEKYKRPDWLAGKLYTVIAEQDDLSEFAECLRIVGLDTIINVSGCFTIFAPNDEAMEQFLAENHYTRVSDIPVDELERMVECHIIQNPWTYRQLHELNIDGWVNPKDPSSQPNAYKRQTILRNPNEKYWIRNTGDRDVILMDSTVASSYRMVYVRSRKYAPLFYDEFFNIYGLSDEDFSFYYGRQYVSGSIYYANARIVRPDIIAENGFVHVIDRVVKPFLNGKEMLERELPGESYKSFLELIYQNYPVFKPNMSATFSQPVFRYGGEYDTLFDLSYPDLAFNLHEELTGGINTEIKYTFASQNGMYVPTDNAFQVFVDEILTDRSGFPHWPGLRYVPDDVVHFIVDHHFFNYPLYESAIRYGLDDGEGNRIYLSEDDIVRKEFGSNCTFLGTSTYTPSRVFTSVTGPVFLRPAFSTFRYAMEYCGAANRLSGEGVEYSFFPIADGDLGREESLIIEWLDNNPDRFYAISQFSGFKVYFGGWDIYNMILNQVGTSLPNGSAEKEYIPTLGWNYLIWDNVNNTVSGSAPTTFGYEGDVVIDCHPVLLGEPADNGKVWSVSSWFDFNRKSMATVLSKYPAFLSLMEQAGLYSKATGEFSFMRPGRFYTIFVPSGQALTRYKAETLSGEALTDLLLYHIVDGDLIFTDNKKPPGEYRTLTGNKLNIRPGRDLIEILDGTGAPYVSVAEAENATNILVTEGDRVTAVIHEINTVLVPE